MEANKPLFPLFLNVAYRPDGTVTGGVSGGPGGVGVLAGGGGPGGVGGGPGGAGLIPGAGGVGTGAVKPGKSELLTCFGL